MLFRVFLNTFYEHLYEDWFRALQDAPRERGCHASLAARRSTKCVREGVRQYITLVLVKVFGEVFVNMMCQAHIIYDIYRID